MHITEARGHAEGLWILVQQCIKFDLSILNSNKFSTTFRIEVGARGWLCTAVYASPTPSCRTHLWHHFGELSSTVNCQWLMLGDFNEILLPGDQRGGIFVKFRADAFGNMLDKCGMVDLNTTGGRFTWHRNCKGNRTIAKKLDRAVANIQWRMSFPEAFVEVLCCFHSDHNPIFLRLGGLPQERGPRPFRFEATWINHAG